MLKKGFIKPKLTIEKIGRKQFWFGLLIGLCFAFIISHLFNLSREALRSLTFMRDPYILAYREFRYYDLFFAALSSGLGFGITLICWFYLPNRKIRRNYRKTFAVSTSFFVTIFALAIVARFGSILSIVVYNLPGYDNHLDILNDFWLLLILIPVYILFTNWNAIRLIFKSGTWVLASAVLFLLNTAFLFKVTSIDRDKLNRIYYSKNKERFEYIENEINSAGNSGSNLEDYSGSEIEQYYFTGTILRNTSTIESRLKQVVEQLKSNDKYKKYHHLILTSVDLQTQTIDTFLLHHPISKYDTVVFNVVPFEETDRIIKKLEGKNADLKYDKRIKNRN